jgi:hypothetical protein
MLVCSKETKKKKMIITTVEGYKYRIEENVKSNIIFKKICLHTESNERKKNVQVHFQSMRGWCITSLFDSFDLTQKTTKDV